MIFTWIRGRWGEDGTLVTRSHLSARAGCFRFFIASALLGTGKIRSWRELCCNSLDASRVIFCRLSNTQDTKDISWYLVGSGEKERKERKEMNSCETFIEFYSYNDSSCRFIIILSIFVKKRKKAKSVFEKSFEDQVVARKWQAEAIVASRLTEFSPENTPSKSRVRSQKKKKPPFEICPWGVVTYASRRLITMGFSAWGEGERE